MVVAFVGVFILVQLVTAETAFEWTKKGISFAMNGEYQKAIECYDKAIELDPNLAEAYNNRGVAYRALRLYESAIEDCNKAIELDPNLAEAYNNRGLAYCALNQYEKAIEDFNKAIELNPNYAIAYNNRERALTKLKEQKTPEIPTPIPTPATPIATSAQPTTATPTTPKEGEPGPEYSIPGFEAIFAISSLLALAFGLRRKRRTCNFFSIVATNVSTV
jgi:tetratricopeptide (TPR) repeat protein